MNAGMRRAASTSSTPRPFKTARLVGTLTGPVRALPAFKRGFHREPEARSPAAEAFIRQLGAPAVTVRLDEIFKSLRTTLGLKRSQLGYTDDTGAASIKTPDFDVHLWIEQNPTAVLEYRLTTEVSSFRRPEVIGEALFQSVFSRHVDTVVIDFRSEIDVEATISRLEDWTELDGTLEDEPNGSAFTLTLNRPPVALGVTKTGATLKLAPGSGRALTDLLEFSNLALAKLMPMVEFALPA